METTYWQAYIIKIFTSQAMKFKTRKAKVKYWSKTTYAIQCKNEVEKLLEGDICTVVFLERPD